GLVFGNVADAMVITAAIQLIYMGVFSPGGQMPSEPCIAAAIAVPVALLSGMGPEAAVGIAVPVGLLGSYLYQFRFFV
ncbi:PTS sugar transporter subunit IIC, partial [Streptococcus anginosus]